MAARRRQAGLPAVGERPAMTPVRAFIAATTPESLGQQAGLPAGALAQAGFRGRANPAIFLSSNPVTEGGLCEEAFHTLADSAGSGVVDCPAGALARRKIRIRPDGRRERPGHSGVAVPPTPAFRWLHRRS